MLIKSSNNQPITFIDIRANTFQPGLLNTLCAEINSNINLCRTDCTPSEEAVREAIHSSWLPPSITATDVGFATPITSSCNPETNDVCFKSLVFSGNLLSFTDVSGTSVLTSTLSSFPGPRGEFSTMVKNFGRCCEVSKLKSNDLMTNGLILGTLPEDGEIGKIVLNVVEPFQDTSVMSCKTLSANLVPLIHAETLGVNSGIKITDDFYLTAGMYGLVSPSAFNLYSNIAERTNKTMSQVFGDTFAYYNIPFPYTNTSGKWLLQGRTTLHKYNKIGTGHDWGMKLTNSHIVNLYSVSPGDAGVIHFDPIIPFTDEVELKMIFQMDLPTKTSLMIKTYGTSFDIDTYSHDTRIPGHLNFAIRYGNLSVDSGDGWEVISPLVITDNNKHVLRLIKGKSPGWAIIIDDEFKGWAGCYQEGITGDIENIVICSDNTTPYRTMIDYVSARRQITPTYPSTVMLSNDSVVLKDSNKVLQGSSKGELRTAVFYDTYRNPTGNKIAIAAGWNGSENLRGVEWLEIASKTGSKKANVSLIHPRREAATGHCDAEGKMYIVGGSINETSSTSIATSLIESINSKVDNVSCLYGASTISRTRAGCANFDNGKMYIVGGYNSTFNYNSPTSNIATSVASFNRTTGLSSIEVGLSNLAYVGSSVVALWPSEGAFISIGGKDVNGDLSDLVTKVSTSSMTNSFKVCRLPEGIELAGSAPVIEGIFLAGGFNSDGDYLKSLTKYQTTSDTLATMCGSLCGSGGQVAAGADFTKSLGYIIGGGKCPPSGSSPTSNDGLTSTSLINRTTECASCVYVTVDKRAGGNVAVV